MGSSYAGLCNGQHCVHICSFFDVLNSVSSLCIIRLRNERFRLWTLCDPILDEFRDIVSTVSLRSCFLRLQFLSAVGIALLSAV